MVTSCGPTSQSTAPGRHHLCYLFISSCEIHTFFWQFNLEPHDSLRHWGSWLCSIAADATWEHSLGHAPVTKPALRIKL